MTGTLFVVATPIGNLADISFRAIDILRSVNTVFCEDTRVTKKLLNHYDIHTPCVSYHSFSGFGKIKKIEHLLREGKDVALLSDAGTPVISDPGVRVVRHIRDTLGGNTIQTIPGASALTAALSISGAPASPFVFLGFLPRKKGRETHFQNIAAEERTIVFYEAPHRLLKTLVSLSEHLEQSREVVVLREMTKIYEEAVSGTATEVLAHFQENTDSLRGEVVVIVSSLKKEQR